MTYTPETAYASEYKYHSAAEVLILTHSRVDGRADSVSVANGIRQSIMSSGYTEMRSALGLSSEDTVFLYWPVDEEVPEKADRITDEDGDDWIVQSVQKKRWGPYYVLPCTKAV